MPRGGAYERMMKHKLLTADRERELFVLYGELKTKLGADHKRTLRVRNQIVAANVRLSANYAKRLKTSLEFDELVSFGVEGLIKAAERFEVERGLRYATFAQWWVRSCINRGVQEHKSTVRTPVWIQDGKRREDWKDNRADKSCVRDGVALTARASSLDAPIGADDDRSMHDMLASEHVEADDAIGDGQMTQAARRAIYAALTRKEREIIECRFGLRSESEETLKEIGDRFGLSRERIRQLESEALDKLRVYLRTEGIHAVD